MAASGFCRNPLRVRMLLFSYVICILSTYTTCRVLATRIKIQEKAYGASYLAGDRKPRKKGPKSKDKVRGSGGKKYEDQNHFPPVSLQDLAAHDLDSRELKRMVAKYLHAEVPAKLSNLDTRCCCTLDKNNKAICGIKSGHELKTSTNPLTGFAMVCPDGFHRWQHNKFDFETIPESCREGKVDLNKVLQTLVTNQTRSHEAMVITQKSLARGIDSDSIPTASGRCCCKVDADPAGKRCQIMAAKELNNGHCPHAEGYRNWDSWHLRTRLKGLPAACNRNELGNDIKRLPGDFAVTALVASSALFETRSALDPAISRLLNADIEVVRRRLDDVTKLLDDTISSLRASRDKVRSRGAWIGAEFVYAVASGALQRALRLLTPVPQVPTSDSSAVHADSSNSKLESGSKFMREFVRNGRAVRNASAACMRLKGDIDPWLRSAVLSAAWVEENSSCNVTKIRQALRTWGAWWEPNVKVTDEFAKAKKEWAITWSDMRASLDFDPWPASSTRAEMVAPSICEQEYMIGDETARFPRLLGGEKVMHTYMVFAGGSPTRTGCLGLVIKMAELFPELSPRGETPAPMKEYTQLLLEAERLGCQGFVPLGHAWIKLKRILKENIGSQNIMHFMFEMPTTGKNGTFELKLRRNGGHKRQPRARKADIEIPSVLSDWVSHTIVKYTAKTGSDDWFEQVAKSLRNSPPSVSAHDLSVKYWSQLDEQGVASPYNVLHCPDVEAASCGNWSEEADGYWESAKLAGSSLDFLISTVKNLSATAQKGDWRLLAQTPAAYGATGFDSPGIVDNSDWQCNKTTDTCSVHPRCARAAAQMLSYSFMKKRYASDWTDRATTYLLSSGKFDEDGFHSYCHTSSSAYCWSYTDCLKEMMNWLCGQEETATHCCPTPTVAAACKQDVNSEECSVCNANNGTNSSRRALTAQNPGVSAETLTWLRPGLEEAKARTCGSCAAIKGTRTPEPIWVHVSVLEECMGEGEKQCRELCGLPKADVVGEFVPCTGWKSRCESKGC